MVQRRFLISKSGAILGTPKGSLNVPELIDTGRSSPTHNPHYNPPFSSSRSTARKRCRSHLQSIDAVAACVPTSAIGRCAPAGSDYGVSQKFARRPAQLMQALPAESIEPPRSLRIIILAGAATPLEPPRTAIALCKCYRASPCPQRPPDYRRPALTPACRVGV